MGAGHGATTSSSIMSHDCQRLHNNTLRTFCIHIEPEHIIIKQRHIKHAYSASGCTDAITDFQKK